VTAGRAVAAAAVLLATVVVLSGADRPVVVARAAAPAAPPAAPTWTVTPAAPAPAAGRPVRVRIPAIGVDSRIVAIGVDAAGALVPPRRADVTGWFTAGPVPGTIGPALLAGHVDSRAGPGVFLRLAELRRGDVVTVDRADGGTVSFVVGSVERVSKAAFPTELVYSPKPVAMLRLVTCGGSFDRSARSYRDNIIVNATIR
jgi:sortase (surface protein transpeptidase)